jgi:hypothetical protein
MERVIPLAGESAVPESPSHPRFRRRGWSVYGAYWSQPTATGGKCTSPEIGSNKPKPLPPVATSCRSERMVRRRSAPYPAQIPSRSRLRQRRIPRSSRWRSPEAPADPRQSPQDHWREVLLSPEIPAYPRSARKRHDRAVTPEVAGSSPVAPVKSPQIRNLFEQPGAGDLRLLFIPRSSRTGNHRTNPVGAGNPRNLAAWPKRPEVAQRRARRGLVLQVLVLPDNGPTSIPR